MGNVSFMNYPFETLLSLADTEIVKCIWMYRRRVPDISRRINFALSHIKIPTAISVLKAYYSLFYTLVLNYYNKKWQLKNNNLGFVTFKTKISIESEMFITIRRKLSCKQTKPLFPMHTLISNSAKFFCWLCHCQFHSLNCASH